MRAREYHRAHVVLNFWNPRAEKEQEAWEVFEAFMKSLPPSEQQRLTYTFENDVVPHDLKDHLLKYVCGTILL